MQGIFVRRACWIDIYFCLVIPVAYLFVLMTAVNVGLCEGIFN